MKKSTRHINAPLWIAARLRAGAGSYFSVLIARIAVGSIAIGLAAVMVSFLIFGGFKATVIQKISSFSPHIRVMKYDLNNSYEDIPVSTHSVIYQDWKKFDGLSHLQMYSRKACLLKTDEELLGVELKGIYSDFDSTMFIPNIEEGSFIDFSASPHSLDVLVSRHIANKLKLKVGDKVIMAFVQEPPRFRKMLIKGIYHTGIEDFDTHIVMADNRLIQQLNNWGDSLTGGFELFVSDFTQLDVIFDEVYEGMDYDLKVGKITDEYRHFFDWFEMLNQNVVIFLVITLAVASFNVVSVMIIMIMERTNMIGTLKALGATNWQIQNVFVYNGLRLIGKGLLWGNGIGIGFGFLQQTFHIIPLDADTYYMNAVPILFDWSVIFWLNIVVIALVGSILFLPTMVISKISPIKAIRFN